MAVKIVAEKPEKAAVSIPLDNYDELTLKLGAIAGTVELLQHWFEAEDFVEEARAKLDEHGIETEAGAPVGVSATGMSAMLYGLLRDVRAAKDLLEGDRHA